MTVRLLEACFDRARGQGLNTEVLTAVRACLDASPSFEIGGVDPWNGSTAGHCMMIGYPGAGRTLISNALLARHLAEGHSAWAIRSSDCRVFDDAMGVPIRSVSAGTHCVNPLSIPKTVAEFERCEEVLANWAMSLCEYGGSGIPVCERDQTFGQVRRAVALAWRKAPGRAGVEDLVSQLAACPGGQEAARRIKAAVQWLHPQALNGTVGETLNDPYVSFLTGQFYVEERKPPRYLDDVVFRTLLALHALKVDVLAGSFGGKSMLVIDDLLVNGNESDRGLFEVALRRARQANCSVIVEARHFDPGLAQLNPGLSSFVEGCEHQVFLNGYGHSRSCWAGWYENSALALPNGPFARHEAVCVRRGVGQKLNLEVPPLLLSLCGPRSLFKYAEGRRNGLSALQAVVGAA